ncbi:MAG: long-chain fatty acid--CoA ligase [bacterium]|nr:long-chain fatty acid--CoA ligase [bacterium]
MANIIMDGLMVAQRKRAEEKHQNPALIVVGPGGSQYRYSWKDYMESAERVAVALCHFGVVKPGEKNFVAVIPLNLPESLFAILGIISAGGVPVPINPPLLRNDSGLAELDYILNDCQPSAVLVNQEIKDIAIEQFQKTQLARDEKKFFSIDFLLEKGAELINKGTKPPNYGAEKDTDDILIMPYTSGTTGMPKGVMLTHGNILDRVQASIEYFHINNRDRIISHLSLGHISDLVVVFFGHLAGGYTVYFSEYSQYSIDKPELFKDNFQGFMQVARPTVFATVPKVWGGLMLRIEKKMHIVPKFIRPLAVALMRHKITKAIGLEDARLCISAAALISQRTVRYFRELDIHIQDLYGQTEMAGPVSLNGMPIGNVRIDLKEMKKDEGGSEILLSGSARMKGYFKNEEATAQKLIEYEGLTFFCSGDLAKVILNPSSGIFDGFELLARRGDGYKMSNGQFMSGVQIKKLQAGIASLSPDLISEENVLIHGKDKDYNVALVFVDFDGDVEKQNELERKLTNQLYKVGEGYCKVRELKVLDENKYLMMTPTKKVKREKTFERCRRFIERMYGER